MALYRCRIAWLAHGHVTARVTEGPSTVVSAMPRHGCTAVAVQIAGTVGCGSSNLTLQYNELPPAF